jgi:hypothetical protein
MTEKWFESNHFTYFFQNFCDNKVFYYKFWKNGLKIDQIFCLIFLSICGHSKLRTKLYESLSKSGMFMVWLPFFTLDSPFG